MLAQRWIENEDARKIISELLASSHTGDTDSKLGFFIRLLEVEGKLVRQADEETVDASGKVIRQMNFALVSQDGKETPVRITFTNDDDFSASFAARAD